MASPNTLRIRHMFARKGFPVPTWGAGFPKGDIVRTEPRPYKKAHSRFFRLLKKLSS